MTDLPLRTRIAHLLRRAGFGASEAELQEYLDLGFEASVDRLLHPEQIAQPELDDRLAKLGADTNQAALLALQQEWLYRMINTKRPLQEKMALFWHGHFATANEKVKSPPLMLMQYQLFLRLGLGNFQEMLLGVSKDLAMLRWLDGNQNRKGAPNENYGRELLELFTLGIGNYTENDVKAAARAFTGWTFEGDRTETNGKRYTSATFVFNQRQHDAGSKTFLGQTGNWNGEEIIAIILKQPACARFIAGKLFSFFVWDNPEPQTVATFARALTSANYDLRETMRAILLSPEFSSEQALHAKIKSPIELVAGYLRTLGVREVTREAIQQAALMGQALFDPPNVGGWTSGLGWIGPGALLTRFNFANRITTTRQGAKVVAGSYFDPATFLAGKNLGNAEAVVDYFAGLLLDGNLTGDQRAALIAYLQRNDQGKVGAFTLNDKTIESKVRGLVHLIAASPGYQLN